MERRKRGSHTHSRVGFKLGDGLNRKPRGGCHEELAWSDFRRAFRDRSSNPHTTTANEEKTHLKIWCGWSDSNRQREKSQWILSPPRMPISPQPHRTATRH